LEEAAFFSQIIVNGIIVILFITIIVILLKLSKFLSSINEKIESIAADSKEIKPKVISTLEKIGELSESVKDVTGKVNENIYVLGNVVEKIKDTTETAIEFQQKVQNAIEPPIMETVNTITAVSAGVKTFMSFLKKGRNSSD